VASNQELIDRELALRAFEQGYAIGADLQRTARHTVDPPTHGHWRHGFDAGRSAALAASEAYRISLRVVEPCKSCAVRRDAGLSGQCPACANERSRR